ncbi:MAG: hypothetical protein GY757_35870 [bacterium]|nr:hypothetical protein [bacterium]
MNSEEHDQQNSNEAHGEIEIISFSNQSREDKKRLKQFVDFHWKHYEKDPQFVPLLDYEFLGFKLVGMIGFFEPKNLLYKHAEIRFFLALKDKQIVGRCNALVNHAHNETWKDKTGFIGHFESVDSQEVTDALLNAAQDWLKDKGMDAVRGPQNMPVNEATPGIMTEGFDSRPVIYYAYNKKYYEKLLLGSGFLPIKKVFSWEVPVMNPMEEKLKRVTEKVIKRFDITIETWGQRSYYERRQEMFEIYNDAWANNFGFIPFTKEEFYSIFDDMRLIIDKRLFQFIYVKGESAAFLGCVPNLSEILKTKPGRKNELLRAIKLYLFKGRIKGFRLGYLGVKQKFHHLGLDGVMIMNQKVQAQEAKLEYADMGWVLDDNLKAIRLIEMMGSKLSKTYTLFEKKIP